MLERPRILLLSAYHSKSHAYWCDGLIRELPQYEWTLKTQLPRHFSWRVRASDWIWGLGEDTDLDQDYDLIMATSLSGLAGLKALRPHLAHTPTWVYFHENQFAHPLERRQSGDHQVGWQFSSLQNALCSNWISFNTAFNRDSFLRGLRRMLKRMPERLPGDPVGMLEARSDVLPVPLSNELSALRCETKDPSLIIWNHRWEWDKQPERLLRALQELKEEGATFRLAMLGSGGGRDKRFTQERTGLSDRLLHWGEAEPTTYRKLLGLAGVGVSCALHDFQGLAMLEAAQAGASIVVPRRVAYPECLPGARFYEGSADNPVAELDALKEALRQVLSWDQPRPLPLDGLPLWTYWLGEYARRIENLIE